MKIVLWIVQILLALAFAGASYLHSFGAAQAQLQPGMQWIAAAPQPLLIFIAICEFLGALGLILPAATKIQPQLTPLAAALLAVIMLLAIGLHLTRGEYVNIAFPLVLGALAAFVAYGRWKIAPSKRRDDV